MAEYHHYQLQDWLTDLEHRYVDEIQLGLTRIKKVAGILNLLKPNAHVITVAGTNGKGSTIAALEAIYQSAGFKVGAYTSPHLLRFNERICINGQEISDNDFCKALCYVEDHRQAVPLTFFEMVTLAALWHFNNNLLDIILLEVGLGGRLDATNIIDPDLAIITTVDFDHQAYLGNTIEDIATEKAGIIRKHTPAIYADTPVPLSVVRKAQDIQATLYIYNKHFTSNIKGNTLFVQGLFNEIFKLPLPGLNSQAVATAVVTTQCLRNVLPVDASALETAMPLIKLYARQQIFSGDVTHIVDVAHNVQAIKALANMIQQIATKQTIHAVFGALQDKDVYGLISYMDTVVDKWYPTVLAGKRGMDKTVLMGMFKQLNIATQCFNTPMEAYNAAKKSAVFGDTIVVFGSFITAGEILPVIC